MYDLGEYKFKCFVDPAQHSCVLHSTDIWTVTIKNNRNMHAFSTNQITDILYFNDNQTYTVQSQLNIHVGDFMKIVYG